MYGHDHFWILLNNSTDICRISNRSQTSKMSLVNKVCIYKHTYVFVYVHVHVYASYVLLICAARQKDWGAVDCYVAPVYVYV